MTVAGMMNKSQYSHNIIRTADVKRNAPSTILDSGAGTVIHLPLPQNLASSMGADWQQQQVSVFRHQMLHNKGILTSSYKDIFQSNSGIGEQSIASLKSSWSDMKEDMVQIMARAGADSSKMGGIKVAINPRNEMLFAGMQFKSYSFTFMLVPYEENDSKIIQQAIREIQRASAPTMRGEKMFMEYPDTWEIFFLGGGIEGGEDYLMKINECSCTNISVNYTPNGDSSNMHENNAPLAVELTLDFTEIFIPTKETIDEGYNG